MSALLATRDFLPRDPVELDHPSLAGKGLVAMPRVVATFEMRGASPLLEGLRGSYHRDR